LLHALLPSGHFARQAASPCRSPSESAASWALANVVIVGAAIESTDKITAILRKSNIARTAPIVGRDRYRNGGL
jgi:hypothetical protein